MGRTRNGIGRCGVGIDAASQAPSAGNERTAVPVPMGLGGTREPYEKASERHEHDQGDEGETEQPR